jgi:fibronectin type 3 domain-containing protein
MKKFIIGVLIIRYCCSSAFAEEAGVRLLCRPVYDSILLRWAPTNSQAWDLGNKYGYVIERYTILRDGELVKERVRTVLTETPREPAPMKDWEPYAGDRYVATAAQCIFDTGERIPAINPVAVARRHRQEQNRFALAMYAADQSVLTARLSGLFLVDTTARAGEKYLYRAYIALPDASSPLDTAFAFTGLSEYQPLPPPIELAAQWDDRKVMLSWNTLYQSHIYNSYVVEKSSDGKHYEPLSDNAMVQLADADAPSPMYALKTDSLENNETTWYYRIRGVNAFGELGPPGDSVAGHGRIPITEAPVITAKEVVNNKAVRLLWAYPEEMNRYISGFRVYRASSPSGIKQNIYEGKTPSERAFIDVSPDLTNYYTLSVFNNETEKFSSNTMYAELIDSIPPRMPSGLAGRIDSAGKVWLTWHPNEEKDLDGYRVYRSNRPDFEFLLISPAVVKQPSYTDSVTLNTLTHQVYYRLRAIDLRQNQSAFSEVLELARPDTIPPVAPVIRSVEAQKGALLLTWINSSSADVIRHHVYRKQKSDTTFQALAHIDKNPEQQSAYADRTVEPGETYIYWIKAEDSSRLYSAPSAPVQQTAAGGVAERVVLRKREYADRAVLQWEIRAKKNVERILIYRAAGNTALLLHDNTTENTYTDDSILPDKIYTYRIKAIYVDGTSSTLSNEVSVKL